MMKSVDKKRILTSAVMVGIICILMVVFTAYSAELRCENNKLMGENEALQSEIETLNVKIKSANNIDHIEKEATGRLGMVYPDEGQCVYISNDDAPDGNFAMNLKEEAYH